MGLDARGDISVVLIIVYIPVLLFALLMTVRHGFARQAGWVFLLTFSIVRIVGGGVHIAAELIKPPNINLFITAFALETAGVAPLLLCTTSLLAVVEEAIGIIHSKFYRLFRLVITIGFILAIVGAIDSTSSNSGEKSSSTTERRVGASLLAGSYLVIVGLDILYWRSADKIRRFQVSKYTLLAAVSCALPFLGIRVLYTFLSGFSPTASLTFVPGSGQQVHTNALSKFNSVSGSWEIFLVMSLLMEFIVVSIYLFFGSRLPLGDKESSRIDQSPPAVSNWEQHQMYGQGRGRDAYTSPGARAHGPSYSRSNV